MFWWNAFVRWEKCLTTRSMAIWMVSHGRKFISFILKNISNKDLKYVATYN
jgi:hypothetical protein